MSEGQNDTKNQSYGYNQIVFFELCLIRCLIKLYFKSTRKKSLRMKTFFLRKRLKNKQIIIPMHHFVIRLYLKPGYFPKRSNLMQNTFYMKMQHCRTFAMWFINKFGFWDSTAMIIYFVTNSFVEIVQS